ncbi:hypothetical protein K9L16_03230 [Candidatus Pacearchaeota archaeon]|nr:hypothetical protein [Candidatus Pacearchaeota archaeon]
MHKKGWLKIVEAFIAIMLVVGVSLILLDQGYFKKDDVSSRVYDSQLTILREVQSNVEFREQVLNTSNENLPIKWDDFEENNLDVLKETIKSRIPNYLFCKAMICGIDSGCELEVEEHPADKDLYAQTVGIAATTTTYNPRQLKLFCWIGTPEDAELEEPSEPEQTCSELGGDICTIDEICSEDYIEASDSERCCPVECQEDEEPSEPEPPEKAILSLSFSDTQYVLREDVLIDGKIYPEVHYYEHTRTFSETNNIGVNLTYGQLCLVINETCDNSPTNIKIEKGSLLTLENKQFWTTEDEEIFNLTYWGEDDNENEIIITQYMCVNRENFTENCYV